MSMTHQFCQDSAVDFASQVVVVVIARVHFFSLLQMNTPVILLKDKQVATCLKNNVSVFTGGSIGHKMAGHSTPWLQPPHRGLFLFKMWLVG